jgi:hypothetical protein
VLAPGGAALTATIGGWTYSLARTADGPLGQANFALSITAAGGNPAYACTFTTGNVADCYYAGPIALSLPGTPAPWLEFYYAADCTAVDWQVTLSGTTADGHDWSAGGAMSVPLFGAGGLPAGLVPDPHNPPLPVFNTPTAPSWWHLPGNVETPASGDHARRVDIVRTASDVYLLVVSDWYQATGDTAYRWHHLFCTLSAGCCTGTYTAVPMLIQNPADPTAYPFASCGVASGVTVTAVPQLCREQCATTSWTVQRGPLTWTLAGGAGGPWTSTGSVVARIVLLSGTQYRLDLSWTDGANYLIWSATADMAALPASVTFIGSDPTAWPATISYSGGAWSIRLAWGTFAFSGPGWTEVGAIAPGLAQQADAGGHGRFVLSLAVGNLALGRAFGDPFADVRNCQTAFAAGVALELTDSNGTTYGTVTATA